MLYMVTSFLEGGHTWQSGVEGIKVSNCPRAITNCREYGNASDACADEFFKESITTPDPKPDQHEGVRAHSCPR